MRALLALVIGLVLLIACQRPQAPRTTLVATPAAPRPAATPDPEKRAFGEAFGQILRGCSFTRPTIFPGTPQPASRISCTGLEGIAAEEQANREILVIYQGPCVDNVTFTIPQPLRMAIVTGDAPIVREGGGSIRRMCTGSRIWFPPAPLPPLIPPGRRI